MNSSPGTEVLVAVVLALGLGILFLVLFGSRRGPADKGPRTGASPEGSSSGPSRQPCPLCGSSLGPGERVHSVVYASSTADKIMEISGCPHCRPPAVLNRVCPVCKKDLRPGNVVTARVFERKNETGARKTHVHVLGCPRCRS